MAATLALACGTAPAAADVLHLRNGTVVEGKVRRLDGLTWVVDAPDRRATFVPVADVASIEITARPATDPVAAAQRLASLRRATAGAADPAAVVDRYRRFLAAGADPATLAAARQDLAGWQGRVDRHEVRLGDRWVDPAARAQAVADARADAAAARQQLKAGDFAGAGPVVAAALAINPGDVSALYLQGLLQLRQNQPAAARASFEAVLAGVADDVPARVNLAVIDWQQGRYAAALARYDEAMILSPANAAVLADAAAAVAAVPGLPPAIGRDPVVARVTARLGPQQQQLAARLTAMGLHRFGSAWLDDDQLAAVRRGQAADALELNRLAGEFGRAQDRVRQTDLALADVRARTRGTVGPWLASYDGGAGPSSSLDLDLDNDAAQLRRRRTGEVAQLDALRQAAVTLRRRIAGQSDLVQRVIGPEGTPVRIPDGG